MPTSSPTMPDVRKRKQLTLVDYPTSDGKPMAETDDHRDLMIDLIQTLKLHRRTARRFYISGNLLIYYEEGNRRKHVSPDVFVVEGVSKSRRRYYLLWEEKCSPSAAIELTSKSTGKEDLQEKFQLYQDILRIQEYFLFDPFAEYLNPPLQGYRLKDGKYQRIEPVDGRLPSLELGLHLERRGGELRFYDPLTGKYLPTLQEARQAATARQKKERSARRQAEAENNRLRREIESLRRKPRNGST